MGNENNNNIWATAFRNVLMVFSYFATLFLFVYWLTGEIVPPF